MRETCGECISVSESAGNHPLEKTIVLNTDNLEFKESGHIYRLDGIKIPSVTEIMKPLSDAEYGGVNERVLGNAANKGTAVHNAIENWMKFGVEDIEPEYRGYFDAFLEWWKAEKPEVVGSELRVYHKLMRYAGTVDLLAYINGELNLIDVKTTYKLIKKNCAVQLEAYSQALKSHGIEIERKRILHIGKHGKWDFVDFKNRDAESWRVFGSLKDVYDYTRL